MMWNKDEYFRSFHLVSLTIIMISRILITSQSGYTITSEKDKAMDDRYILNTFSNTGMTVTSCFEECLKRCACSSFQICDKTRCELCWSTKYENSSALQNKKGCFNFVFERNPLEEYNQQCSGGCSMSVNCCLEKNPCLNGGTCLPPDPTQTRTRYKCKCPDGYTGRRCQKPITSCRGYNDRSRTPAKFKIFDMNKNLYEVFCDFETLRGNWTRTWTLILSYAYEKYTGIEALIHDQPLNQNDHSWNEYRLSKPRMTNIKKDSSKWRITCQYENQNLTPSRKEYVRGSNKDLDIMVYQMEKCFRVDRIKVRDRSCRNCTVQFQHTDRPPHFDSATKCGFDFPNNNPGTDCSGPQYFGDYTCTDPVHQCSNSPSATTQIWFGH